MAHGPGTFWVSAALLLVWLLRRGLAGGRLPGGHLFLLSFTTSMAVLCRATNGLVLFPFLAYLLAQVCRAGLLGRLVRLAPAAVVGLAPFAVQVLVWQGLYGRPLLYRDRKS